MKSKHHQAKSHAPVVGSKRSRNSDSRGDSKRVKQVKRYFQEEPSEAEFKEITESFAAGLLLDDPPPGFPSRTLREEILYMSEDLQALVHTNNKWNNRTIDWCLQLLCSSSVSHSHKIASIKLEINHQYVKECEEAPTNLLQNSEKFSVSSCLAVN